MLRKAGFNAIRVPVTWYYHLYSDGRNLIIPTWRDMGSPTPNQTETQILDPIRCLELPNDIMENHIIIEIHEYFSTDDKEFNIHDDIDLLFNNLQTYLQVKGAPVVIGEWALDPLDRSGSYEIIKEFIRDAKANNVATFIWDARTVYGNYRRTPAFENLKLVESEGLARVDTPTPCR